ncbi:ABC transporter substrate-binding protein [Pseudactinotalea sp. Z1739]|uniref:ABC transporter substrate-binding protein n=1 Tax=Pseudactinotalea sp. Z1739 TaxID=3413028 RepID=UPI003C7EB657
MAWRNRLRAGIAVGSAAILLAACAPGEVEGDQEAPDEPVEVDEFDPAEHAGETLNYVYFTDGPDEQATRDIIADFEAEYDVSVNLEILPYADLVTSVQARLSGGDAPDVVRLTGLSDFRLDLLDLRPYLGEEYADEFLAGPMSGALGPDGEILAVPSDLTLNGPFINLDMFDEAGVEVPDVDDPWTWEEMVDAANEVRDATGAPYAFAMDKSGHRLSTILSQYGTALVADGEAVLDVDAAVDALSPLVDMMDEDVMSRDFWLGAGSRYEGANEMFLAQDVPVYLSGNWQVGQFAANADFEWAAAPNPCAVECGGFPGGKYMAAFDASDNPALAAEFIRYVNSAENQEPFVAAGGFLPTRADLADDGVDFPDRQEDMDIFLADLVRTPDIGYAANGDPAFGGSADELISELDQVVAGNKDLPDAMADLRESVESLIDELH